MISEETAEPLLADSPSPTIALECSEQAAEATLPERSDPEKENAHAAQSDELEVYMKERRRRAKKKMTPLIILGAGISSIGLIVGFALLVAGFPELSTPFMFYGTPIGICIFGFAVAWICNYPKLKPGTTTKPLIKFLLALIAGFHSVLRRDTAHVCLDRGLGRHYRQHCDRRRHHRNYLCTPSLVQ